MDEEGRGAEVLSPRRSSINFRVETRALNTVMGMGGMHVMPCSYIFLLGRGECFYSLKLGTAIPTALNCQQYILCECNKAEKGICIYYTSQKKRSIYTTLSRTASPLKLLSS